MGKKLKIKYIEPRSPLFRIGHISSLNKKLHNDTPDKYYLEYYVEGYRLIDIFGYFVEVYAKTLKKKDHIFYPQLIFPKQIKENTFAVNFFYTEGDRYSRKNERESDLTTNFYGYYQSPTYYFDSKTTINSLKKIFYKLFENSYYNDGLSPYGSKDNENVKIDMEKEKKRKKVEEYEHIVSVVNTINKINNKNKTTK